METALDRIGEKHITNEGYEVEIIEYFSYNNCTIKFTDGHTVEKVSYGNIKRGFIKNKLHKSVYSIGYLGNGEYKCKTNGRITPHYQVWKDLIKRCYYKYYLDINPTYIGVTVCEEWHNFQNFAGWFEDNYKEGFELDKDLLVKGNKIYSPETCCFVPQEINLIFMSNRKKDKQRITHVAEKYKNKIKPKTYQALIDYEVEITD